MWNCFDRIIIFLVKDQYSKLNIYFYTLRYIVFVERFDGMMYRIYGINICGIS
jgi:hypothetical protein